jgi:hypothetical protein
MSFVVLRQIRWAFLAVLWAATIAPAVAAQEWTIDDANPSSSIPSAEVRQNAPLQLAQFLFELTDRGEKSLSSGDHARAARYFEAVVRLLPEQSIGHAKLCEALAHAGAIEEALMACQEALVRPGVRVQDYVQFLAVTLIKPGSVSPEAVQAFDATLAHLEKEGVQSPDAQRLNCQLALSLNDTARLSTCVKRLEATAPEDSRSAGYAWVQAMRAHDEKRARAAFDRLTHLHHDPAKLGEMKDSMAKEFPDRSLWYWAAGLGLVAVASAGLFLALRLRATPAGPTNPTLERAS